MKPARAKIQLHNNDGGYWQISNTNSQFVFCIHHLISENKDATPHTQNVLIDSHSVLYCKQRNAKEIVIHAQFHLKSFYERFGFKTRGEIFIEAGIKHIEMYMTKTQM